MAVHYHQGDGLLVTRGPSSVLLPADAVPGAKAAWRLLVEAPEVSLLRLAGAVGVLSTDAPAWFAIVCIEPTQVHVVLRGEIEAVADDGEAWSGAGYRTWAERRLDRDQLERLSIGATGGELPIESGVALAGGLTITRPGLPLSAGDGAVVLAEPSAAGGLGSTGSDEALDALFGATVDEFEHHHDRRRTSPSDRGESPWPAGSPPGRGIARLSLSTGELVDVTGPVAVGAAPDTPVTVPGVVPVLVSVPGEGLRISSTHAVFRPRGDELTVTDVSSYGVVLTRPGQPPHRLPPQVPVPVAPGHHLDLGDGVTIVVLEPER